MTHHNLRIDKVYWDEKISGNKLFEIRYNNDRGFQKGDTVSYSVKKSQHSSYVYDTKAKEVFVITYVTPYNQKDGFVVFGDRKKKD